MPQDNTLAPETTVKQAIEKAIIDLYYPSESDEIIDYFSLNISTTLPLNLQDFRMATGTAPNVFVQEITFKKFFKPVLKHEDWFTGYENDILNRFKYLYELFSERLSNFQVFRVGNITIDVYVLGKNSTTDCWEGIKTRVIET